MLASSLARAQTPISCLLLPPQFSSAAYDVAAVVRHAAPNQGASVTLLWGHRRFAGGGAHGASQAQGGGVQNFNPMSSPTVRKQMHQGPASAASFTRRCRLASPCALCAPRTPLVARGDTHATLPNPS